VNSPARVVAARLRGTAAVVVLSTLPLLGAAPGIEAQRPETGPEDTIPAYMLVIAGRLNIRARPGLDAPVVGTALRGETLCLIRYDGDWAEVRSAVVEGGRAETRGFVSRGFVAERRASPRQLVEAGCPPRQ
jgi:Bacterial SH3 domain